MKSGLDVVSRRERQAETEIHIVQIHDATIFIQELDIQILQIHRPKVITRRSHQIKIVFAEHAKRRSILERNPSQDILVQERRIEGTVESVIHIVVVIVDCKIYIPRTTDIHYSLAYIVQVTLIFSVPESEHPSQLQWQRRVPVFIPVPVRLKIDGEGCDRGPRFQSDHHLPCAVPR